MDIGNENNIFLYNDEESHIWVEVLLENEDVWLNVEAIAKLFGVQRPAITKHINNIYNDDELDKSATCSILEQVQIEGNRKVKRRKEYYNLDMIISIGFRVNSKKAIKFRSFEESSCRIWYIYGATFNTCWKRLFGCIK